MERVIGQSKVIIGVISCVELVITGGVDNPCHRVVEFNHIEVGCSSYYDACQGLRLG